VGILEPSWYRTVPGRSHITRRPSKNPWPLLPGPVGPHRCLSRICMPVRDLPVVAPPVLRAVVRPGHWKATGTMFSNSFRKHSTRITTTDRGFPSYSLPMISRFCWWTCMRSHMVSGTRPGRLPVARRPELSDCVRICASLPCSAPVACTGEIFEFMSAELSPIHPWFLLCPQWCVVPLTGKELSCSPCPLNRCPRPPPTCPRHPVGPRFSDTPQNQQTINE